MAVLLDLYGSPQPPPVPTGWLCVSCHRVMAPHVSYCLFCPTETEGASGGRRDPDPAAA